MYCTQPCFLCSVHNHCYIDATAMSPADLTLCGRVAVSVLEWIITKQSGCVSVRVDSHQSGCVSVRVDNHQTEWLCQC